ncbi:RIK [Symbiodinium pilosum]|uniref:RIK protein n=1 Tax=Symbiodinium pilosum TaxID=2952 RepID=A0A812U526_SYMPI|nr:RIK [Symbiodinium pilosum]
MSLLGAGYDSEGEDSAEAPEQKARDGEPSPPGEPSPDSGVDPLADEALLKKRKIDYSKLPMSRRPSFETPPPTEPDEAPLKKAAELAANPVGQSLLAALPPPKVTLGRETGSSSIRLDLEDVRPARNKSTVPVEGLLRPDNFTDLDEEAAQVPDNVLNHPMFSVDTAQPDGPSADDLLELRKPRQFVEVNADDMKDPDWYMKNQMAGGPGLLTKKRVADDVSMFDGRGWRETTHSNPSKVQKRKHQINWLANEALENEADMLERGQQRILSKAQTHAKYGW